MASLTNFGSQYKGYATNQGFTPLRPADPTPLLRQNQQTTERAMDRVMDHEIRMREINNKIRESEQRLEYNRLLERQTLEEQSRREADAQRIKQLEQNEKIKEVFDSYQMNQLAQFSQSLTNVAMEGVLAYKDHVIQTTMAEAFSIGLPPAQVAGFKSKEAAAEGAAQVAKETGRAMEGMGVPVDLIERARNSSGWKRYAYNKAIMMMAGQRYNTYRANNHSAFTVKIGDRDVSLATAANSSEYAAVETTLRNQFLQQFEGMNVEMMNEHLFPAMRQVEERQALAFSERQRKKLEADRQYEFKSQVWSNAIGKGDAFELQKTLKIYASELGGMPAARKLMYDDIKKGLEGGIFGHEDIARIEGMLNQKVVWNDGSEMSFKQKFPRDFAVSGIQKSMDDARWSMFNRSQENLQNTGRAFMAEINSMRASLDRRLTNDEITQLNQIAKSRGIDHLVRDDLNDIVTKEDHHIERSKDHASGLIELQGYITENQAADLAPAVRAMYRQRNLIVKKESITPDEHQLKAATKLIKDQTNVSHWEEGGAVKPTKEYRDSIRYGNELYLKKFAANVQTEEFKTKEEAHENALAYVEKAMIAAGSNFGVGEGLVQKSGSRQRLERLIKAGDTLKKNNYDITQPIPDLKPEVEQFDQYVKSGKGELPFAFKTIVSRLQGGETAWDFAIAQHKAHGFKDTPDKPDVEKFVDGQSKLVQRMMRWRPTQTRNLRAGDTIQCPVKVQGVTAQERALLCTIQYAEGTFKPDNPEQDAYRTMVGGGRFESLKVHPDYAVTIQTINGPITSYAAGAYQFLPTTYQKHKMPDFSEESQDKAALAEIREAKVDPTQPLTPQMIDLLAPVWASFPTLRTGTSYYGQGGKKFEELLEFYEGQLQREIKARERYSLPQNMLSREGRQ